MFLILIKLFFSMYPKVRFNYQVVCHLLNCPFSFPQTCCRIKFFTKQNLNLLKYEKYLQSFISMYIQYIDTYEYVYNKSI